jgi:HEPN domain-containing protein
MADRTMDWINQAKSDLEHAEESLKIKHYEWTCLASQQAAEKAVKAIFYSMKAEVWGHGIARLLKNLPVEYQPSTDLIQSAHILDRHYIPARYPNGLINGTPRENFTLKDAEEAIVYAKEIIEFCENSLSKK